MGEAPIRKRHHQPEALLDFIDVPEPKRFHDEERNRFLHILQIAKTLADDDDDEFSPSEELLSQVMKSLEEAIGSKSSTSYPSARSGDNIAVPDICCRNQAQTRDSDSGVDLRHLLKGSDDDIAIPPNLVVDLKAEVDISTKKTT